MVGEEKRCYPLCKRDIAHEDTPLAWGRGVLSNKVAMRISFLSDRKSSRGEWLVKHNDAILFVREILFMRRTPCWGGGVY